MPIIPAPDVGTYSTRTQYVTAAEFLNAPTGVDTSQLVPGGSTGQNIQALEMQLQRASAWADNFCQQVIAATVNVQAGRWDVRTDRDLGPVIRVPLDYTPIIAVTDVQVGYSPSTLAELSSYTNVWIGRKVVTIPVAVCGQRLYGAVSYVNGYANTAFTTATPAGSTSVTVASPLGIMPGQQLNLQAANDSETVTVAANWVPSITGINVSIPLTTPTVNTYAAGDTVTAFPQDIKQAVILIAKALILTKGSTSVTIPSYSGQPSHEQPEEMPVGDDLDIAEDLLAPYRRII